MPCICYGAKSGVEEYDEFIASEKGQEVMKHIVKAASIIMAHQMDREVIDMSIMDFRQMFVKCFLHMMIGCDENGKPKANVKYDPPT